MWMLEEEMQAERPRPSPFGAHYDGGAGARLRLFSTATAALTPMTSEPTYPLRETTLNGCHVQSMAMIAACT